MSSGKGEVSYMGTSGVYAMALAIRLTTSVEALFATGLQIMRVRYSHSFA